MTQPYEPAPARPLAGRRALITGASAGIGAATARAFHAAGAEVFLAARRRERLAALAKELTGATVLELDVRQPEALQKATSGRQIDLLLANAGLARGVAPIHESNPADWAEVLETNVVGVLSAVRACLPWMLEQGRGDVVLLGSVAGRHVYPGGSVYCASKYAVHALYQAMREDAGGRGVRFTSVDPGMVETEFSQVRFRGDEARSAAVYKGFQPLTPEDVARTILFAVTQPPHVNIGEIVMWPSAQISVTRVNKQSC